MRCNSWKLLPRDTPWSLRLQHPTRACVASQWGMCAACACVRAWRAGCGRGARCAGGCACARAQRRPISSAQGPWEAQLCGAVRVHRGHISLSHSLRPQCSSPPLCPGNFFLESQFQFILRQCWQCFWCLVSVLALKWSPVMVFLGYSAQLA